MHRLAKIVLALCVLVVLASGWMIFGPGTAPAAVFQVGRGEKLASVATRLKDKGLLRNRLLFRSLARLRGLDRSLRPGRRRIPAGVSPWRLVAILRAKPELVKVAVPEGRTCWDIAGIVGRAELSDSLAFARLCEDSALAHRLGIRAGRLEGYLFPDTYYFDGSEAPEDVAGVMVHRFRKVFARLDTASSESFRELGAAGVLTLASIVEREAANPAERPLIAGVFYKRLHVDMTLGADPTVRYALRKFTGALTVSDLAINSPYNTRKFEGLPPGPISNPGKESLKAALHPDMARGYLYFVAKDDGSRRHDFSADYRTFLKDKDAAAKRRARSGAGAP
jgi:peptidoglycan lytic transglycosylase G